MLELRPTCEHCSAVELILLDGEIDLDDIGAKEQRHRRDGAAQLPTALDGDTSPPGCRSTRRPA
jgi:hypothetical protein